MSAPDERLAQIAGELAEVARELHAVVAALQERAEPASLSFPMRPARDDEATQPPPG